MLYNLKEIRISQGLTLKQLAIKTGISPTYLNDLENLKCNNPSYKIMQKLTKTLNRTIKDLEGEQ